LMFVNSCDVQVLRQQMQNLQGVPSHRGQRAVLL